MKILGPLPDPSVAAAVRLEGRGLHELAVVAGLYLAYAASRVFANEALAPARERAARIRDVEDAVRLDVESSVVGWFVGHDWVGLLAAYYYASAHYLVTGIVMVWVFRRHAELYPRARRTLVHSTLLALVAYLVMPTAPPRLVGYADVMAAHAVNGWWGEAASAPRGLAWMTNQLAAFPSMHAGWALWVALVVTAATTHVPVRLAAWAHAVGTAVVVIGTGNHWVLDVVAGWGLVLLLWRTTVGRHSRDRDLQRVASLDGA